MVKHAFNPKGRSRLMKPLKKGKKDCLQVLQGAQEDEGRDQVYVPFRYSVGVLNRPRGQEGPIEGGHSNRELGKG